MRYRDLPQNVRERITDYYEHKYSQKRLFNELEILSEVSKPLRDVSKFYHSRKTHNSKLFISPYWMIYANSTKTEKTSRLRCRKRCTHKLS